MRSLILLLLVSVSLAHDVSTGESHTHTPRPVPSDAATDPPVIKLVLTPPTPDDPIEPTTPAEPTSFAVSTFAPITPPRPSPTIKPVTLVVGEVVVNNPDPLTEESNEMDPDAAATGVPIQIQLPSVVTNATDDAGTSLPGGDAVNATFTIEIPTGTEAPQGTEMPVENPVVAGGPDSMETTDLDEGADTEGTTNVTEEPDSTERESTTNETVSAESPMEITDTTEEPQAPESPLVSVAPNGTEDTTSTTGAPMEESEPTNSTTATTPETPLENATTTSTTIDPMCASHSACGALEGACCPALSPDAAVFLSCCGTGPVQETCIDNPECSALELEGACCPTSTGVYLDCCAVVPDECGDGGECVIESALEYKAQLEQQEGEDGSTAADTSGAFTMGSTAALLSAVGMFL